MSVVHKANKDGIHRITLSGKDIGTVQEIEGKFHAKKGKFNRVAPAMKLAVGSLVYNEKVRTT